VRRIEAGHNPGPGKRVPACEIRPTALIVDGHAEYSRVGVRASPGGGFDVTGDADGEVATSESERLRPQQNI
jgi:hypothetical protein